MKGSIGCSPFLLILKIQHWLERNIMKWPTCYYFVICTIPGLWSMLVVIQEVSCWGPWCEPKRGHGTKELEPQTGQLWWLHHDSSATWDAEPPCLTSGCPLSPSLSFNFQASFGHPRFLPGLFPVPDLYFPSPPDSTSFPLPLGCSCSLSSFAASSCSSSHDCLGKIGKVRTWWCYGSHCVRSH